MKTYLLCKSKETLISLRLAGIEGKVVKDEKDIKKEIEKLLEDKEVGIIAVSESLAEKNIRHKKQRLQNELY
ncbi:MAG: V-type ATP synthase subunit F [bacterium]